MGLSVRTKIMGMWLHECIQDNQLDVTGGFDEEEDMKVIYEAIVDDLLQLIEYIKELPDEADTEFEFFEKDRGH